MAEVGVVGPKCNAGVLPVRIEEGDALAAWPWSLLVIRRSGCQWTSHCRSSRHLCPVVVLDILSCVFIPPSFLWSCLPPSLFAVWHHHAAVSTSIKEPLGRTVCLLVGASKRGINMEQKECCKPPLLTSTALLFLQVDGLLGQYKTICTHPHHPSLRRVYPKDPCCACSVWWRI